MPDGEHENSVDRVVRVGGERLVAYLGAWFDTVSTDKDVLKAKFEEVVWMNTVTYAVGGWAGRNECADDKKEFNGDFLLCVDLLQNHAALLTVGDVA